MKNWPIITFLARTWMLLAFAILTNFLTLWKHVFVWVENGADEWGSTVWRGLTLFDICGAVLYLPGLASVAYWVSLLLIHLNYRQTIDKDVHDNTYLNDWRALTSAERVMNQTWTRVGFLVALAIIVHGLAK